MPFFTPNVSNDAAINYSEAYATVTTVTGDYTAQKADINTLVMVNSGTGKTVTLPANFPVGACISFVQYGAGAVTFAAASGATIPQGAAATGSQYTIAAAIVVANADGASAVWIVSGV